MEANIDQLIARYSEKGVVVDESELDITGELGKGASGVTYSARLRGEDVAVKFYDKAVLRQDFQQCRNEIDLMTAIEHDNIITFKGMILQDKPPRVALVTQLAPGGELGHAIHKSNMLRRGGRKLRFKIALGMARGLSYLAEHGIVHRDIKPANVLLSADCDALLTDFGLSRYIDPSGEMTGVTGSYRYMAPEVIRSRRYSGKADVYSFAVVLNELFTGELPYLTQLPLDAARSVVKGGCRPSQRRCRSKRVKALAARCWDTEPARRPDWPYIIAELEQAQSEYLAEKQAGLGALIGRIGSTSSNDDARR